jgi:CBS domain-containing protein
MTWAATTQVSATAQQAAQLMKEYDVGNILVCDRNRLVGIVTDRDLAVRALCEIKSDGAVLLVLLILVILGRV